jgi:hypothetical protein
MKRISLLLAACIVAGIGLIVAAEQKPAQEQRANPAALLNGPAIAKSNIAQGFSEIVTVSQAGDVVAVYSIHTGRWHKQRIAADQGEPHPSIGVGVVAFRTRSMIYACSSETGAWDSVELPDGVLAIPTVGKEMAVCRGGKTLYGFSAVTGAWDSIELDAGVAEHPTMSGGCAYLESGSKVYAFSSKTGNWSMFDRAKP